MGASGTSRRSVLLGTTGLLCGLVGCSGRSPGESRTESTSDTGVPEHHSTADASATFRVVDTHRPTDDAVTVTYAGAGAMVTGTMDPAGCDRPALASLDYEPGTGSLRLVVAGE